MSRILLVEDEEHLALGLRFNLENAGYEVELARSGPAAIEFVLAGEALVDARLLRLQALQPGAEHGVLSAGGGAVAPAVVGLPAAKADAASEDDQAEGTDPCETPESASVESEGAASGVVVLLNRDDDSGAQK